MVYRTLNVGRNGPTRVWGRTSIPIRSAWDATSMDSSKMVLVYWIDMDWSELSAREGLPAKVMPYLELKDSSADQHRPSIWMDTSTWVKLHTHSHTPRTEGWHNPSTHRSETQCMYKNKVGYQAARRGQKDTTERYLLTNWGNQWWVPNRCISKAVCRRHRYSPGYVKEGYKATTAAVQLS